MQKAILSDNAHRRVRCFVDSDGGGLETVLVSVEDEVADVKTLVCEKRKNSALCNIDAADLFFCKVTTSY